MERKIISIPPNYFYLTIVFIVICRFLFPSYKFIQAPYNYLGFIIIFLGCLTEIWAWLLFKKYKTPEDFSESVKLVTEGIFKITRNPMYLGMLLMTIGLSFVLNNYVSFIGSVFLFLIVHFMFIPFEEEKNYKTFGQQYLDYKSKVRKWL